MTFCKSCLRTGFWCDSSAHSVFTVTLDSGSHGYVSPGNCPGQRLSTSPVSALRRSMMRPSRNCWMSVTEAYTSRQFFWCSPPEGFFLVFFLLLLSIFLLVLC